MKINTISVNDVADFFLAQMSEECGDTISNLKLQKLVYYAQGFHLAVTDKPLFVEKIKAWDHGPAVPQLWHRFKQYGAGSIPKPAQVDFSVFSESQKELLSEVYRIFGQFSAWKLRNMTHIEPPWKDTKTGEVITHKAMKEYFKTKVNKK